MSVKMDDEEFDDLLAGVDLLQDSSQESLTSSAANLEFCDDSDQDDRVENCPTSPPSSVEVHDGMESKVEHAHGRDTGMPELPSPDETGTGKDDLEQPLSPEHLSKYAPHCCAYKLQASLTSCGRNTVLEKIEEVFERIADALLDEKDDLAITLKTRVSRANVPTTSTSNSILGPVTTKSRRICFPGKTAEEAWRFSKMVTFRPAQHC